MWTHRILLEAMLHEDNCFVTLTYSDEQIPTLSNGSQTLLRRDFTLFLKRLRKAIHPLKVRYYGVGEYGDETLRPHYHLALFGYPNCRFGQTNYRSGRTTCCPACDTIRASWGNGNTYLGDLSRKSAQYVAGYVTKKMTRRDDPRLDGRDPEFGAMSLKPGIGQLMMHEVGSPLLQYDLMDKRFGGDVPVSLDHGGKGLPLGRYLRRELRSIVGLEKTGGISTEQEKEMLAMLKASTLDPDSSLKKTIVAFNEGKHIQIENREKLYRKKGVL